MPKSSNSPRVQHNAEAILNPHTGREPGWKPAIQPDSVIGYDTETGQPLTKAEVFPEAPAPHPSAAQWESVESRVQATQTNLEKLQENSEAAQALDLDVNPRQYEPDDGSGGWDSGRSNEVYKGDISEKNHR
jgi:hypothetical protein